MSRFLSLKKKKPTEKHELNKAEDNTKDKDYGSITSLINNEVWRTDLLSKKLSDWQECRCVLSLQ